MTVDSVSTESLLVSKGDRMPQDITPYMPSIGQTLIKETQIGGKSEWIKYVDIGLQTFATSQGLVSITRLEDEWYDDVDDPSAVIRALQGKPNCRPDIFTFWQRVPDFEPRYTYHREWEEIAVLPVTSYEHWWNHQIKSRIRNLVRKSEKEGVIVREVSFDDDFVRGITTIFNEVPVRQGRRFWHYGKDFETVKREFSRYLFREHLIGAYYQDELIGFIMLGNAGKFGVTGQILSMVKHRDKAPNNALIAKAVEVCERLRLGYLVYLFWGEESFAEFKRRCGFEKILIPRYYVPLTLKGRLALKCGAHHGWRGMLPARLRKTLKQLRRKWYELEWVNPKRL
jgi:hypothetical protein